jgi:hypothetical protein
MLAISDKSSYISSAKLSSIQEAAQADCDILDNAKDGVLEDPAKCKFDPAKLLCPGAETDRCLTRPQLSALRKIYGGPSNEKGEKMFPGFPRGVKP